MTRQGGCTILQVRNLCGGDKMTCKYDMFRSVRMDYMNKQVPSVLTRAVFQIQTTTFQSF